MRALKYSCFSALLSHHTTDNFKFDLAYSFSTSSAHLTAPTPRWSNVAATAALVHFWRSFPKSLFLTFFLCNNQRTTTNNQHREAQQIDGQSGHITYVTEGFLHSFVATILANARARERKHTQARTQANKAHTRHTRHALSQTQSTHKAHSYTGKPNQRYMPFSPAIFDGLHPIDR